MQYAADPGETVQELLGRLQPLFNELRRTVSGVQAGVPTFYNVMARTIRLRLESLPPGVAWRPHIEQQFHPLIYSLCRIAGSLGAGRFVSWERRTTAVGRSRDLGDLAMAVSQGTMECMHWKGIPLFKTVFECAIYSMMLWELRPATIVELGSGTGSSAIWFADLLKQFDIDAHIHSIDINRPAMEYEGVTFIEGDVFRIRDLSRMFENSPRPWLVIEDAHVNVEGVLACMHELLGSGDYLVIEDSSGKHPVIDSFMREHNDDYNLDTRYIDFFGTNDTSAMNSVFVRT